MNNTQAILDKLKNTPQPDGVNAVLILEDGSVFWGQGAGAAVTNIGEVIFNTAMTGYQEILTDPSYAGQIITFTFPHIGNVGTNLQDYEDKEIVSLGLVTSAMIGEASNYRSSQNLDGWLKDNHLPAICGVDTRSLTIKIREQGAAKGAISYQPNQKIDLVKLLQQVVAWQGLEDMDLAPQVSLKAPKVWLEGGLWQANQKDEADGFEPTASPLYHVVAIDYGIKNNILRKLDHVGCKVTIVPFDYSAEKILALKPDGIFLSNGPGDPAATGITVLPIIKKLIQSKIPIFGICLGHQILGLALGAKTLKMKLGHHGANHPIQDLTTQKVEITSQNHGFVVDKDSLPANIRATHFSLFDGTLAGMESLDSPLFSVQYHPEASPGPQDSHYLFVRFTKLMETFKQAA